MLHCSHPLPFDTTTLLQEIQEEISTSERELDEQRLFNNEITKIQLQEENNLFNGLDVVNAKIKRKEK